MLIIIVKLNFHFKICSFFLFEKLNNTIKVIKAFKMINSNPNLYVPKIPKSPFCIPGEPYEKYHKTNVTPIAKKQINGTSRSLIYRFVIIPKKKTPIKGPYVNPANFINKLIAESVVLYLRIITVNIIIKDIKIWTNFRVISERDNEDVLSFSTIFKKSTEKDVVKEVKAESALEYAAAINPNKNNIPIIFPAPSLNATAENNKSGLSNFISFISAYI